MPASALFQGPTPGVLEVSAFIETAPDGRNKDCGAAWHRVRK